ncbi:rCG28164 [Rattus norvegicus]|uniref:RCG28164 n=1 Tax=Rattus norvegicus TaxID=10116 RepID=A6IE21_RAT|nr:rCG28164 [Rattus norvegicus]
MFIIDDEGISLHLTSICPPTKKESIYLHS